MKSYFVEPACSLLMPALKLPPLLTDGPAKEAVRYELERKYGTRMSLDSVSNELGLAKNVIKLRIGNAKFQHNLIYRHLYEARVFAGKNTSFWTHKVAQILIEGNTNGN
ncbi:hypothetical protein ACI0X9_003408 [Cronobacter turicensis]